MDRAIEGLLNDPDPDIRKAQTLPGAFYREARRMGNTWPPGEMDKYEESTSEQIKKEKVESSCYKINLILLYIHGNKSVKNQMAPLHLISCLIPRSLQQKKPTTTRI